MGKILNATYHDTVDNLTGFYSKLINNPFYTLNDKKPTLVTYYNINTDYTSVDPGSKIAYDNVGPDSPIRFNRIYDMLLYGFSKIELANEIGDFGLESNTIEGEAYILPGTIVPYEGDFFEVDHIKDSTWLFIVKDVQKDTLDNGSNAYKISYRIEYDSNKKILDNIVYNFKAIDVREGTNIHKIVRCEDYEVAKILDEQAVKLKKYFNDLFYSDKVQTFIFKDLTGYRFYDPFMIEFLIRNKILDNGEDDYVHVTHQVPVVQTFSLEYDRCFLRAFELKDQENLASYNRETNFEEIKAYGTIFASRYENYFRCTYKTVPGYNISCLNEDLMYRCIDGKLVEDVKAVNVKSLLWQNVIIKYFTNQPYTTDEIKAIDDLDMHNSKDAFYTIPLLIFCLENRIEETLK